MDGTFDIEMQKLRSADPSANVHMSTFATPNFALLARISSRRLIVGIFALAVFAVPGFFTIFQDSGDGGNAGESTIDRLIELPNRATALTTTTTTATTVAPTTIISSTTTISPTITGAPTTTIVPSATIAPPAESVVVALPLADPPLIADIPLSVGGDFTVTFSGLVQGEFKGFVPGEFLQLIIASTPQVVGSGYADAQGGGSLTGQLPADFPAGSHTLAVYAPVSGIGFKQPISVEALTLPATGSSQRLWPIMMMLFGGAALIVGSRRRLSQT